MISEPLGFATIPSNALFSKKAKGLCVCLADNNALNVWALGVLSPLIVPDGDDTRVYILCFVRRFNESTGNIVNTEPCDEWVPLAK